MPAFKCFTLWCPFKGGSRQTFCYPRPLKRIYIEMRFRYLELTQLKNGNLKMCPLKGRALPKAVFAKGGFICIVMK